MEDPAEVDATPKKSKKHFESENGSNLKDKTDNEFENSLPNGTGNSSRQDQSEESIVKEKGRAVKITKVSKSIKAEQLNDTPKTVSQKRDPVTPTKVRTPSASPSSSSLSEDFCGFQELSDLDEQLRKKEAFNRFLSSLEDIGDNDGESEGEPQGKTMTVEDADGADSDSNQMEIDEGNSRADSAEYSDKNDTERTRDSDVDVMETDSVKSVDNPSGKAVAEEVKPVAATAAATGSGKSSLEHPLKIEYCGTCSDIVDDAEEGICCDGKCERWFHLQCSGLTQAEYEELSGDENAKWACNKCSGKPPPEIKPGAKPLINVRKDLAAVQTPSPKRRVGSREGKSPRIDISNPIYLKPFDYGWKRELVYRSTNDNQNKRQGDVYYYTPKGKKLRSLREISEHLIGTDLTPDNFTFWKDALGCDSEKEIIRDAKIKLTNKESNASSVTPKKVATPKISKTPKAATPKPTATPKLTATVTPLDSASGLPVAKASASVTPRVVLKSGKSGTVSTGPKFKVTPSKTTTAPGQTQKIVISKGAERVSRELLPSTKTDIPKSDRCLRNEKICSASNGNQISKNCPDDIEVEGEEIDIMPKNKFRRYGLLANRISTRNIARKRRSRSSSSSSSCSVEDLTSPDKEIKSSLMSKHDSIKATGLRPKENNVTKLNKSQSKNKTDNLIFPSISTSVFNGTANPTLTPDRIILPNPNARRPRSPEIQFRPSDPSSYGCQTSTMPPCRPIGPSISSSYRHPFETVLMVDTSPTDSLVNSPKRRTAPYKSPSPVQWTHDCSIEVFSVETLPSKDGFSNEGYLVASPSKQINAPLKKQSTPIRAVEGDRNGHSSLAKNSNECSPVSVASSSMDVVILDEDAGENSSPPFLIRNSPPPKLIRNAVSPNRSPPNLQANLPPPPLLHCPSLEPCSSHSVVEPGSNIASDNHSVITINSGGNSTSSLTSCEPIQESEETGSKYEEYRKLKRERFHKRRKAKHQTEKLKRLCQVERHLFLKRKAEEKGLQLEYLRLKVKMKSIKMSNERMKRKRLTE